MDWTLDYLPDLKVVSADVEGEVTVDQADAMLRAMLDVANARSATRFLIDHSRSTLQVSTADIVSRANHYEAIGFKPESRFAIVFPAWTPDSVLIEAAVSRKYSGRVFIDRELALRWLASLAP